MNDKTELFPEGASTELSSSETTAIRRRENALTFQKHAALVRHMREGEILPVRPIPCRKCLACFPTTMNRETEFKCILADWVATAGTMFKEGYEAFVCPPCKKENYFSYREAK